MYFPTSSILFKSILVSQCQQMEFHNIEKLIKGVFLLKEYFDDIKKEMDSSTYEDMSKYSRKLKSENFDFVDNPNQKPSQYFKWEKNDIEDVKKQ